ncbi:MAG: TspO/MBR family protein [Nocardioides sp.]
MTRTFAVGAGFLVLTVLYAAGATYWTASDPGWYAALTKPGFQPPDLVFGVIWPLNFLALGAVGILAAREDPLRARVLLVSFGISVIFALSWAYLFYVPHQLLAAAVCLGLAAAGTWLMVAQAWRIAPYLGLGLIVYATWMSVATALAAGYHRLN